MDSNRAVERGIDRNRILVGLIVPRDYAKHVAAGQSAAFQILLDGSDSNTASIALSYVNALVEGYSNRLRAVALSRHAGRTLAVPIDFQVRIWYNSSLESKNFVVPGLVAVILVVIAGMLASLTIAREWEMGTMEQLLSTPVRPSELVLAKMLGFFTVGVVDTVIAVLVGVFVFDVPFRGSVMAAGADQLSLPVRRVFLGNPGVRLWPRRNWWLIRWASPLRFCRPSCCLDLFTPSTACRRWCKPLRTSCRRAISSPSCAEFS